MSHRAASPFSDGKFASGVAVLLGGTAGAQLLAAIAAPLLTRLYSPEDFGVFAVYAGAVALIGALSSFYYFLAIPLPEDDVEAANIAALCLAILGIVVAGTCVLVFFGEAIAAAVGTPMLEDFLWLLPVGVFCVGVHSVFSHWAIRAKRFRGIAKASLGQAVVTLAIQLAGYKAGAGALMVGHVAGQGAGSAGLSAAALKDPAFRRISGQGMLDAAKRHRRFPLFLSWAGLFGTAGIQLPPLLFAALFNAGAAGLFALAARIMVLPVQLVGNAVGNVFLSDAPAAYREGSLGPLALSVHDRLAQIAMPPAILVLIAGPDLFAFVFGEDWALAGTLARWMAPWIYFMFCDSGLRVLIITGHQQLSMVMHGIQLAVRIAAIAVGAHFGDLVLAVMLYSAGSALTYGVFIVLKLRISDCDLSSALRSHLKALLLGVACVVPVVVWAAGAPVAISLFGSVLLFGGLTAARYVLLFRFNV